MTEDTQTPSRAHRPASLHWGAAPRSPCGLCSIGLMCLHVPHTPQPKAQVHVDRDDLHSHQAATSPAAVVEQDLAPPPLEMGALLTQRSQGPPRNNSLPADAPSPELPTKRSHAPSAAPSVKVGLQGSTGCSDEGQLR